MGVDLNQVLTHRKKVLITFDKNEPRWRRQVQLQIIQDILDILEDLED